MATSSDTVNMGVLLSACIDAAQKAGEIIRAVWKSSDLQTKDKGVDDLFTQADIRSQQLIMGMLAKQFGPKLAMVGEEECDIPPTDETCNLNLVDLNKVPSNLQNVPLEDLCVFIDPLDATKEYTVGNLEAVMSLVGVSYKGEAVAGVMYQPFIEQSDGKGTTIWAMIGMGAYGFTYKPRNDGKLIVATTRTHGTPEVEKAIELIKPDQVIRVGGAGHKVLILLEGRADMYLFPTPGTKKWDTCAPEVAVRCVGGSLTDKFGKTIPYFKDSPAPNKDGVLSTLKDHQKYVDMLKDVFK